MQKTEWKKVGLQGLAKQLEIMIPYDECKNYTFKQIVSVTKSSDAQAQHFLDHVLKKRWYIWIY